MNYERILKAVLKRYADDLLELKSYSKEWRDCSSLKVNDLVERHFMLSEDVMYEKWKAFIEFRDILAELGLYVDD